MPRRRLPAPELSLPFGFISCCSHQYSFCLCAFRVCVKYFLSGMFLRFGCIGLFAPVERRSACPAALSRWAGVELDLCSATFGSHGAHRHQFPVPYARDVRILQLTVRGSAHRCLCLTIVATRREKRVRLDCKVIK